MTAADRLTSLDWRVIELVRDGRPDAEIAVRLGTSVGAVRAHVSRIVEMLGLSSRDELREWQPERPRSRRLPLPIALSATALVIAGIVVALAVLGGDNSEGSTPPLAATEAEPLGSPTAPAVTTPNAATPSAVARAPLPLPFEQHEDYREYGAEELRAAGFIDTGAFIVIPFNPMPVARSSYRAGFTAIEVTEAGYVNLRPEGWHRGFRPGEGWGNAAAVALTTTVEGVPLYATFSTDWGLIRSSATTRLLLTGEGQIGFYAIDDGPPKLMLAIMTGTSEPVPAVVDTLGHLWVRLEPLTPGPIADDTGERIDIREATAFGPLPYGIGNWSNLTWCEIGPCTAVVHLHEGGGLNALASGRATCEATSDTLRIELSTEAFTIRFDAASPNAMNVPGCDSGFPRDVKAGDRLSAHPWWEVSAFAPDGAPIDVAVDRWRMLYIGAAATIRGCPPCNTGS